MLLGINKPQGCTSHDVVARARRALHERRIGHAGTLDPLATGVMVLGVGQATRLLGLLTQERKEYLADIVFGCETNTDDAEGMPTREVAPTPELRQPEVATRALSRLVGPTMQVPPAFSAISVNGVRSYKRAREGEDVELPARPITVYTAQLISITQNDTGAVVWTVAFAVSKGTYIRALARDLGRAVGGAAHIGALQRTASGCIHLASCLGLDDLGVEQVREHALDPVAALGVPSLSVSARDLTDISCGRPLVPHEEITEPGQRYALVHDGALVALGIARDARIAMEHVFPQPIEGVSAARVG